jgi:hypothetical protein
MPDRLDQLEQTLQEVARTVSDLELRLAALEGAPPAEVRPITEDTASEEPTSPEVRPAASTDAQGSLATKLPLVGRTFLVLGGAFLLRALTNAGTLPAVAGVSLGLVYSLVWIGFAQWDAGRKRSTSAAFHGLAAVLVAYPLLFESVTRFEVLSPVGVGMAVTVMTMIGLGVAWLGRLSAVAWWFALASTATLVALQFTAGRPVYFSGLLVVVGIATLMLAYTRGWGGQRWLVAIPANLSVLRAVFAAAPERGAAEVAPTLGPQVLIVLFLLSYLCSFAILTLARRRPVGAFEIVQSAAVLLVGIGGAVHVTQSAGAGGGLVGISALVVGAMSYAAAFSFVRSRLGRGRNFFFYSSLGLVLVITGSRLLGLDGFCTITWGILAVAAAFLGGRFDRVTLRAHSAAYAIAAAIQSGLLSITVGELVGTVSDPYRDSPWALPALLFITLAYGTLVATRAFRTAPRLARIPRFALALVSLLGVTALVVFLVVQLIPEGAAEDQGFVAAIRTAVLAVAAVSLAFVRRRVGLLELGWLSVFVLAAGALKLVLEDLRAGGASALFVAFAFYGIALILVPRLLRVSRAEA